ncbi:hypothetical protein A8L34_28020 [Bacillus sp. FJAT-27264]|uniref:hypothetical protein n=1 Tax=Paenibacillus sp. (strain DSM 101736 / FJAT-27264) TaxID=1850362 RepID=UPI000807F419|nr:hypothetical protein [Bacillus sp. FJAT-27264]OBZ15896.1 hypothetical protein A8L34_28020 [Bacillus sp. FJAT-27264]
MTREQITSFIVMEMNRTLKNVHDGVIPAKQGVGALSTLGQLAANINDHELMRQIISQMNEMRNKVDSISFEELPQLH